jgi:anti-sigma factor RsiW
MGLAMNCDEARELLGALADGELAETERRVLERHIAGCPDCREELAALQTQTSQLRRAARFGLPDDLEGRIRAALSAEDDTASAAPRGADGMKRGKWLNGATHAGAALIGGAIAASVAVMIQPTQAPLFGQEALAAHIGAMMTEQFAVVVSSSSHTVKPWFAGKLDFSPPVVDLADKGFPLRTGHVDYLMDRPVAVLDYDRGSHHISLFVIPGADAPAARHLTTTRGYSVLTWQASGFSYAAVSDADSTTLDHFVALFRSGVESPDEPAAQPTSPQVDGGSR